VFDDRTSGWLARFKQIADCLADRIRGPGWHNLLRHCGDRGLLHPELVVFSDAEVRSAL